MVIDFITEYLGYLINFVIEYRRYLYVLLIAILAVIFYSYIYHLYSSEKSGKRNFEKYGGMAIYDDINDTPIESMPNKKSKLNNEGEQK